MKKLSLLSLVFLLLLAASVTASGKGTYGNETYGDFSYGISSLAAYSFNRLATITANNLTIIDATAATNITLEVMGNRNASGFITMVQYNSTPAATGSSPASPLNKYADIVIPSSISNSIDYSIIRVRYSNAEVSAANLQEDTMKLYRWNGSSWSIFDGVLGGINASGKYVFANTSAFSIWGIFGTEQQSSPSSPSTSTSSGGGSGGGGSGGGGGGGPGAFFVCNMDWKCSEWSDCASGSQLRQCNFVKVAQHSQSTPCSEQSKPPVISQSCEVKTQRPIKAESIKTEMIKPTESNLNAQILSKSQTATQTTAQTTSGLYAITGAVNRVMANPKAVRELKIIMFLAVTITLLIVGYKLRHKRRH